MSRAVRVGSLALAAAACFVVFGGAGGLLTAIVVPLIAHRLLCHLDARSNAVDEQRLTEDLPYALALLAAALRTGSPIGTALEIVGAAVGGPVGAWWSVVAAALRLGASPAEAWHAAQPAADAARGVSSSMIRAARSGAALANSCERLASRLRAIHQARQLVIARRSGVLTVLPLATCLLPAFVLWGVVPIVIDLLSDVSGFGS